MSQLEISTSSHFSADARSNRCLSLHSLFRGLVLLGGSVLALSAGAVVCPASQDIDVTLASSARWEMCWETRDEEGVVLSNGYFTDADGGRRKVFKSLSVSQINVVFDDASTPLDLVTGPGLGGGNFRTMLEQDCPGGTRHGGVLCERVESRGYAYKSYSLQKQGSSVVLSSASTPGASTYLVRWSFGDDGSVAPAIGLSGDLPRVVTSDNANGWPIDGTGAVGVGFTNNYFWRMDFDLGTDAADDAIEELEIVPSLNRRRKTKTLTTLATETARAVNVDLKRSWRILDTQITNADGRAISYHLEPMHTAHRSRAGGGVLATDVQFTRFDACERFATNNAATNCGDDVLDYVDGESTNAADVVMWYSVSYHHLPRVEDASGVPVHWDGFVVVPRDWTSVNPLALVPASPLLPEYRELLAVAHGLSLSVFLGDLS